MNLPVASKYEMIKEIEDRMRSRAIQGVLDSSLWLEAKHMPDFLMRSPDETVALLGKWEENGEIISLTINDCIFYPEYCFGFTSGVIQPEESISNIIRKLRAKKSRFGIAVWLASLNSHLGGARPLDLIKADFTKVAVAAEQELDEISHG